MTTATILILITLLLPQKSTDSIDIRVKAAMEVEKLPQLYSAYVSAAQKDPTDSLSRYGAIVTYQKLYGLNLHKLSTFDVQGERARVLRMSDQAITNAPSLAYPLLAKIYLLSTIPEETFGPRPLDDATRSEWREQTVYDPRTGTTRKEKILVYVFDGQDRRMRVEIQALVEKALRLEPRNPKVLLLASQVAEKPETKVKYVRLAARADAKRRYPVGYFLAAYEAYDSNKLAKDAALARAALEALLKKDDQKMWVRLFRLQHRAFRTSP